MVGYSIYIHFSIKTTFPSPRENSSHWLFVCPILVALLLSFKPLIGDDYKEKFNIYYRLVNIDLDI